MKKIHWSKHVTKVKDWIVKSLNHLIHYKALKQGFRNPMSPRVLRKKDTGYESVRELDFAICNKDCNNVALTGIYGSGKSSIIKTVLRKHPFKKVLKLSLSRYIAKKEGRISFDEKEVERSIFQHILYKSNPDNTPLSKFKRITHRSYKKAFLYALCILILIWSGVTLWKPEWLETLEFKFPFTGSFWLQLSILIDAWKKTFATLCLAVAFVFVIAHIIRRASKFGIRSIKIKDISFDVDEKSTDFNKLLEELLYFLKAGKYNMVIFEDLDRIDDPKELFLKFREINLLLNESEYYRKRRKRIVFVYAIRDDVFQEEERTKFFDYIVPVIPVVDHFNASDYLLKNYKEDLNEVDDKDILALGFYIQGMRQLLNVMNEYGVYKRMILKKPLSQTKLLAITIYKNLFPEDYSKAHTKEGCLYNIFENKKDFSFILTENDEKIVADLNKQIDETKTEIVKQRKVLSVWAEKKGHIIALIINAERYPLEEVIERDDLYHQVETNAVERYVEDDEGDEYQRPWNFKFNEIVSEVDEDDAYSETMGELNDKLFKLVSAKNKVQKNVQVISHYALQKIIQTVGDGKKTLEVATKLCGNDETKAKVLHSFIRNGYLDDDYKAYLSFTYPGAMTSNDFEFVHSVLQGVPSDYNLKLQGFKQILESIHTNNFSHESILNFSLLKYLLAQKDEVKLDLFIKTARAVPGFIVWAFLYEEIDVKFYKRVFEGWHHCIREILKTASETDQKTMLVLFWREAPQGLYLDGSEKAYLNGMYGAICDNLPTIEQKSAIKIIKEYNLKFDKLRKPDEASNELFDYILKHSGFTINGDNLSVIYGDAFKTSSYTQVMKGEANVYKYINEHIAEFMSLIPESDTRETEEALVEILNNKLIDREIVKQLLGRQENKLVTMESVNADCYRLLFELDKIVPSWNSIGTYYSVCPEDKELVVGYIKKHVDELKDSKVQEEEMELQTLLLTDNETLSNEQYEVLAKCFDGYFEISELDGLEESRLKIVINNNLVEYTKEAVDFFSGKSDELMTAFIIHFIDDIEKDEIFDVGFSNELGLRLLNSELTLKQKKWLLDSKIVINEGVDKFELAKQVCYYSKETGVDNDTDVDFVVDAIEAYTDDAGWKVKIDLINAINAALAYNEEREVKMINALGGGYPVLNNLGESPKTFDNKEENRLLFYYLRDKEHNVSKVIPDGERIKVTFKKKKQAASEEQDN